MATIRDGLSKLSGICAVLYSIVVVVALMLGASAGLLEAVDPAEVLPIVAENQAIAATATG